MIRARETEMKPTKAHPHVVEGVTFRCYRTLGGFHFHWMSDCERLGACSLFHGYHATVDGRALTNPPKDGRPYGSKLKQFRSLEGAMRAAVKQGKKS